MPDPAYRALLDELWDQHCEKSGGYGTGLDPYANFHTVAEARGEPRWVYPTSRILEKCARILSLTAQGRDTEIEEFKDIAGLAICAESMRRADTDDLATVRALCLAPTTPDEAA